MSINSLILLISCLGFPLIFCSKLDTVVLSNGNDIFEGKTETNSNGSWHNEGFIPANATQMSTSLGEKVDSKMKILLATKQSSLSTNIKYFEHTFLSIKFEWMIGQTVQDPPTTTPEPLESTSIKQEEEKISSTTELPHSSKSPKNVPTSKPKSSTPKPPVAQQGSTTGPKILKLNTHSIDDKGHRVIEIAIDSGILVPAPTSETSNTNAKVIVRKKRALNSEEISQIHKILTLTKTSKSKKETKDDELKKDADKERKTGTEGESKVGVKVPYETWKASMDKKFRPPGFYVTVADRVVFDNWAGIWSSPTVMGRSFVPTPKDVWNETTLLVQFDEQLDQNIKIDFDWEPTHPAAYLLLSNITISTFAARPNTTEVNETEVKNDHSADHHQNITLYIVVKQDDKPKEPAPTPPPPPPPTPPTLTVFAPSITDQKPPHSKVATGTRKAKPIVTEAEYDEVEAERPSRTRQKQKERDQPSHTGLIVACVTGVSFFVILVFLLQKKMKLSRKNIRGC